MNSKSIMYTKPVINKTLCDDVNINTLYSEIM